MRVSAALCQQSRGTALCAFTPARPRTAAFKDLPTCKSQGLAIDDYYVMRPLMAPPGLTAAQQKFWVDVFKKVYESANWKDFMADNALDPDFRSGHDFKQFINDYEKLHSDIATKNKWAVIARVREAVSSSDGGGHHLIAAVAMFDSRASRCLIRRDVRRAGSGRAFTRSGRPR